MGKSPPSNEKEPAMGMQPYRCAQCWAYPHRLFAIVRNDEEYAPWDGICCFSCPHSAQIFVAVSAVQLAALLRNWSALPLRCKCHAEFVVPMVQPVARSTRNKKHCFRNTFLSDATSLNATLSKDMVPPTRHKPISLIGGPASCSIVLRLKDPELLSTLPCFQG